MISVDLDTNTASGNGVVVDLTPQQAEIAHCLATRKVARHEWLIQRIWNGQEPAGVMRALWVQVHNLRTRLAPLGVTIRSRRGFGYVLEVGS